MKIQAAVLREAGLSAPFATSRPLTIETLDLAAPGSGEVLVRIEAAGLCHSDLSVVEGNRPRPLPMALGHEAAGIVEAVGDGVDPALVGSRVATTFLARCGSCPECHTDGRLPCRNGTASNVAGELPSGGQKLTAPDGPVRHHLGVSAFATHAIMDRRSIVPVAEDVPPIVAALSGCAALTGGGAVLNAAHSKGAEDTAIVGLGGVGMAALLTAVALAEPGRRVIGIDQNEDKLARARELGATDTFTPAEASAAEIRVPIVIEAAGHPRAFETAISTTAPGGVMVTVGLPSPTAMSEISPLTVTASALTIIGSYQGSAVAERDIPRLLDLWRAGKLPLEELVSGHVALGDINEALDELAAGRAVRQIITPEI